jgi:hypothetical protein
VKRHSRENGCGLNIHQFVIPAKAGISCGMSELFSAEDPGFRRDDKTLMGGKRLR